MQGPLPHLIYRTPLLPAPLGCREPGKRGEGGGAGQLGLSYLLLPTGCLFAVPAQSAPPNWPKLRRKRQVRGPHSLGLQDLREWSKAGHPHLWLGKGEFTSMRSGARELSPERATSTGPHFGALRHCMSSALVSRLGGMAFSASWGLAPSLAGDQNASSPQVCSWFTHESRHGGD